MKKITIVLIYCLFLTACASIGISGKHQVEYVLQLDTKDTNPKTQETTIQIISNRLISYGLKPRYFDIKPLTNNQISIKTKEKNPSEGFKKLLTQKGYFAILEVHPAKEEILKNLLQLNTESSKLSNLVFSSENSRHSAELASALEKDTAQINAYLALPNVKSLFPENLQFMWGHYSYQLLEGKQQFALYPAKTKGKTFIPFDSQDILKATTERNYVNLHTIFLNFKKDSHQKLEELTARNVENFILLTIDGTVYSASKVMEKLTGGSAQISGNFTEQEAIDMANILQSGCLPTGLELISESLRERE
ncbi:MAG: SecDF P1 head subdomain-containing protein [Chitinophagales bacterium]